MQKQYNDIVEINPSLPPKASVIWLHGLGADGYDFVGIANELDLPEELGVRFVFPHAPIRKITLNSGYKMRGWFDVYALSAEAPQDAEGMKEALAILEQLVAREISLGISSENIIIAGFSQGATVALHAALTFKYKFAGILSLSGFLLQKILPSPISVLNKDTPILMMHGEDDDLIPMDWALIARDKLLELEFNIAFETYAAEHNVCAEEIAAIAYWIQNIL